uniref:Diacylglycerol kinase n=1 Tax=Pyxicephalus adspersus TaxID=30357 RepID=A0AAV3AHB2_PYXAD|nr:TPA: hypothetical protein GDO54_010291 [Pyxicephalus adspersus]
MAASLAAADSGAPAEDSSDSEPEPEPQKLSRKVSTSGQIKRKAIIKEGHLHKQTSSFQRWRRRYFKLRGRTLYYAKTAKSIIFEEVDITDASVAESSTKNLNNSFTVFTPFRKLILSADNRKDMEEWMAALKSAQNRELFESAQYSVDHFSGMHNWYACSHARPTYCNVCREALSGVTSHGLSCEVCKFKSHKRCAVRATNNCKWTTLASIGKDIIEDEDGVSMPHQWLEGNLPVSAKCTVCEKTCGSVLRLQDWQCLWCKASVHTSCKELLPKKCPLGLCKVSVIPPTALNSIDSDGFWKATCPPSCTSPLLVFVNSKSGDNQGVKFLRRFKQLLNPAQVFDLMNGGPHLGLRLFQKFDTFRILVCGGDGSVGWVLSEIDALNLHKQCQLGVLPLGTGNDLARVLGWGSACDDDAQLPQILEKLERAGTKMLDRWSIMVYETKLPAQVPDPCITSEPSEDCEVQQILVYEDSVAAHLSQILSSDQHSVVISSAKVLCETVKDFVARVGKAYEKMTESCEESETMAGKCTVLREKLDSLLKALNEESQATSILSQPPPTIDEETEESSENATCPPVVSPSPGRSQSFRPREQLMLRANSLKKAIRQIIEQAEKAVDEQNAQTTSNEDFLLSFPPEDGKDQSVASTMNTHSGNALPRIRASSKDMRAGMSGSLPGDSMISRLLISADTFTSEPDLNCYTERCVMNNYFGIGLDAKISLDFNNKRDEHPKKCRCLSLSFSVDVRVYYHLPPYPPQCDGVPIPLPSLQGIAVLNIPSYAGGTNFWGGNKEDDTFAAPSFDDKILEVVAVFGSMQMAVSRVIKLQHHRIAQCRTVKITVLGDEGVPVQVDGEAWIQPPGYIRIVHKNRTQTLTRDRVILSVFIIKEIAVSHQSIEQELAHAVNASSKSMEKVYNKNSEGLSCNHVMEMVTNVRALLNETELLLKGKMALLLDPPQKEQLTTSLSNTEQELRHLADVPWLSQSAEPIEDEGTLDFSKLRRSSRFKLVNKFKKEKNTKNKETRSSTGPPAHLWGTEEVSLWLEHLSLSEYKEVFTRHDIRGCELLHLERRDLKELGVTKVGHMKRILHGIRELSPPPVSAD